MEGIRQKEIDWLRGFAIFLVVLAHSIITFPVNIREVWWCSLLYVTIYSFHMPLFFAISGYCYSFNGNYGIYIGKKAKRLLLPYVVFASVTVIPRVVFKDVINRVEPLQDQIENVIFYGGEYWFLYVLFIIFLIFPLVEKIDRKSTVVTFAGTLLLSVFRNSFPYRFLLSDVAGYLFFFYLGYLGRKINIFRYLSGLEKTKNWHKAFITATGVVTLFCVGLLSQKFTYNKIADIGEALVGIAVCLVLTKTFPSFLKSFGRYSDYSLPIYLLNGYWLVLSREFAVHVLKTQSPALIIVINTVVDFYVSYLFIKYVMARIPVVRTVSGIKPPQNSKTA